MATKEEILDSIANLTVLELSELLKGFEERFGVTAAAPVAVAAVAAGGGAAGSGNTHAKRLFPAPTLRVAVAPVNQCS